VSMGTSVWVPGNRIWLRVRAAEDVSGAAARLDPMGLPFAPSIAQAPDPWEWLLVRGGVADRASYTTAGNAL
jgi:hypothetical protein